jgi:2-polyprenyl-3-methyl-5-hydroxy-6-metoxy-1,4-benzoquinol methylase
VDEARVHDGQPRVGDPDQRSNDRERRTDDRDSRAHDRLSGQVPPGHYALKQIFSRSAIIAWSHRSRFRLARQLLEPHKGERLLDYGCGDGTLLAEVADLFPDAVGADPDAAQIEDCRRRFSGTISFATMPELGDAAHDRAYDVVTCMEVLEHCLDYDLEKAIRELYRLVAPGGTVIISVPIEIGPALLGKHVMRTLAGWRSIGDYKYRERYTLAEVCRMMFATERTAISRPVHINSHGPFYVHKGFNWRMLRTGLRSTFDVRETHFSPFDRFDGLLSSQAWFVCRRT